MSRRGRERDGGPDLGVATGGGKLDTLEMSLDLNSVSPARRSCMWTRRQEKKGGAVGGAEAVEWA